MPLRILSYNVNGIRSAASKGLVEWLSGRNDDILCFQEMKATPDQFDTSELEALGYKPFWHSAEKKGYSGVATFTKIQPDKVVAGCGMEKYDREGRILRTDFGDWTLLNCYFPSGTTGDERQAFKMEFLDDFFHWIQELRRERPRLVIVGDYNIAHHPIDIHDPVGNKKSSGFLPEEREWMSRWFESGFTDAFRHLHPDAVSYSWWSFRAGSRGKNKGWRIDYQSVSDNLRAGLRAAAQLPDAVHSDHCPAWVEIEV